MKSLTTFFIVSFLITFSLKAQSDVYFKVGIGISIGKEQAYLGKKKDQHHSKYVYSSLGAGKTITLGIGYLFEQNVGAEFAINYFIGNNKIVEKDETNTYKKQITNKTRQFYMLPSMVFWDISNDLIPYSRSGLIFALYGNTTVTTSYEENGNHSLVVAKRMYNPGIGYQAALGVFNSTTEFTPYGELTFRMLSLAYKSEVVLSSTINNVSNYEQLSVAEKNSNYLIELVENSNTEENAGFNREKATDKLLKYEPMNGFGFNVGGFYLNNIFNR